jgi:hypothetical protein
VATEPERESQRLTKWLQRRRERELETDEVAAEPESDQVATEPESEQVATEPERE